MNTPPPKRSLAKILLIILATFISLMVLCAAVLPTAISSKWGNDKLIGMINQQIPGSLSVERLSLSWFGPQELHGTLLKDAQGEPILSLKKGMTQSSLFQLLLNDLSFTGLTIDSLNGTLSTDAQGNTNFEKALNKKCCQPTLPNKDKPITIMFKNVNALINLGPSGNNQLTVHLAGETSQNTQSGKFSVDAQLKGIAPRQLLNMDPQALEHLRATGQAEFKMNAEIVNLPVALVDQFVALKRPELAGLLQEALGQQLNLTLNQITTSKGLEFTLNANSAQMTTSIEAAVNDLISLKKPLTASFKVTPQLLAKLVAATKTPLPWRLKSPATAELIIDSLQYPVNLLENHSLAHLDITPLTLNATLKLQPSSLSNGDTLTIDILQFIARIQTEANKPTGMITINGQASHNGQTFAIDLNVNVVKPKKLSDFTNDFFRNLSIQGDLKSLPIEAIDAQLGLNHQLTEAVGNSADISISLQSEKNKLLAALRLKSDFLDIPNFSLVIGKEITLNKPVIAKVYISPKFIEKFAFEGNSNAPRLRDTASAVIKINRLYFPWQSIPVTSFFPDFIALDADMTFSSMLLTQLPFGNVALNDLNLHISGESLSQADCIASCTFSPIEEGLLYDVLGEQTKITASTTLSLAPNQTAAIDSLDLKIASNLARMNMTATLRENNMLTLTAPAVIHYTLTSAALRSLGVSSMDNFLIQHDTPLELKISKSKIPLNLNELSALAIAGDIKVKDLSLSHRLDQAIPQAFLDKLDIRWALDIAARAIRFDFNGDTRLGQQQDQGAFSGNAVIDNWTQLGKTFDFNQAVVHFKAKAYKLPAAFVGAFIKETDLTPLIGDSFETNLSADIDLGSKALGSLVVDLRSELLAGSANFTFNNGVFLNNATQPAQFDLTLTPRGYAALRQQLGQGMSDLALSEPAQVKLRLRSLSIPWQPASSQPIPFWQSAIDADIYIDKLVGVDNQTQNQVALNAINGRIYSENVSQHTAFNLYAEGQTNSNLQTSLNVIGALEKGFSDSGTINRNGLSLNLDATLTNLPIPLLCQFACLDAKMGQKLDAIIGPNLNAKIKAQLQHMNGPIFIEMKGMHGHTILDGQLYNGTLTLNNNFYAELTVTPQLGRHVFQDLIPFLSGMLGSDQPIKLAIAKEGFALPLQQFTIENISIGSATLELGKVRFSNEGQLAKVLSLLTTASANEVMVWLTPTYFSLNNGLFALQRVDMLISDRYPVAAWGKVNIPADKVNMVIGLSGAAISKAFSVPGIKNSYMLQLPLRGTMKNTSIDKSKAVARLSALVAQSQGGPQGLVLGTVLDIASGNFAEESPPAPTTQPLPWSAMMDETNNQTNSITPVEEIKKIVPIEKIGKGAGSLLKKIFKRD